MANIPFNLLHDDDLVGVLRVADDLHILAAVAGRHHRVRYQVRSEHFVVSVSEGTEILKVRGGRGIFFVVVIAFHLFGKLPILLYSFETCGPFRKFIGQLLAVTRLRIARTWCQKIVETKG